jgi:hypothetical protein
MMARIRTGTKVYTITLSPFSLMFVTGFGTASEIEMNSIEYQVRQLKGKTCAAGKELARLPVCVGASDNMVQIQVVSGQCVLLA